MPNKPAQHNYLQAHTNILV